MPSKLSKTTQNKAFDAPPEFTRRSGEKLTVIEGEVLVQYDLDCVSREYSLSLEEVEDKSDSLLRDRNGGCVGTRWVQRFIAFHSQVKTRVNRVYNYQKALCRDPAAIKARFELVRNTIAKYWIQDCDLYNFDATSLMMGRRQTHTSHVSICFS